MGASDAGRVVVVVGAGQAGLAVSHELTRLGVDHVVLERSRVAQAWRDRWDSFTLVTPNWSMRLPGAPYAGSDPGGFAGRDEVVGYLESYAASAPVREGVGVQRIQARDGGGLLLTTTDGDLPARSVVVCTGAYQRPHRPVALAEALPHTLVLDAADYRSPDEIPTGRVLVVGSGQTGAQLAEELQLAGREVVLACGRAPWAPRRLNGRDIVDWLEDTPFFDLSLAQLASPATRLVANIQATGRDGGHDLHYRTLQALGVRLTGRVAGVDAASGAIRFAPDLAASVAFGDDRYADLRTLFETHLPARGLEPPPLPRPEPFVAEAIDEVPVSGLAAVVLTAGFRPGYNSWVELPVFDELGFPVTRDGATDVPGLFFCGVHFMRKRRSALLFGVGEDAELVAAAVAGQPQLSRAGAPVPRRPPP